MPSPMKHEPTDASKAVVRELSAFGINEEQIAARLGLTVNSLKHYYADEIKRALPELIRQIAGNMARIAMNPKGGQPTVTAGIFMTKTLGKRAKKLNISDHGWDDGMGKSDDQTPVTATTTYSVLPDNGRGGPLKLIEGKKTK